MLDAIKNLLTLLTTELYDPIYNAFIDNQLMKNVLSIINKILNAIFKLWNNENVIELTISDISTILTITVLILLLYVVIKLFVQMFKAITESINDIKPYSIFGSDCSTILMADKTAWAMGLVIINR